MFITCKQCSTTFRLDEKRLKPTGSKVRCSQCGNLFIVLPTASVDTDQVATAQVSDTVTRAVESAPQPLEDRFDQELDGIDLAELDSILERDRSRERLVLDAVQEDRSGDISVEEAEELDERDLDLDFESALALDEDHVTSAEPVSVVGESEEIDLDMDFELGDAADFQPAGQEKAEAVESGDSDLGEDLEMALDDFEGVLDTPEDGQGVAAISGEAVEEELSFDMDLDLDDETAGTVSEEDEPELSLDAGADEKEESLAEDLGLGDLGAALDDEELLAETEDEDIETELSLDDGAALAFDKEPESETAGGEVAAEATHDDEFDLTDLDELLDEEETQAQRPETEEQLEFSLDEGHEPGVEAEQPPSEPAAVSEDDDLDLSGFDALLDADQEIEKPEPEELELSLDDEAELDLSAEPDLELQAEVDSTAGKQDDDFDLGGLDTLLEEVDAQADESEPEELELSLDDDAELTPVEEPVPVMGKDEKPEEESVGLEDLEFELDAEFEDKPISKTGEEDQAEEASEADEELDLSDIEKMLEDDTLVPEPAAPAGDLDLELVGGAEKWVDEATDDLGEDVGGEIDLTEIEAAIDAADDDIETGIDDDLELELDLEPHEEIEEEQAEELDLELELEQDVSSSTTGAEQDDTDEIDLSDLDLSIEEEKPESEAEIINAGDIELEFQIEDEAAPAIIDSAETLTGSQTTADFVGETRVAAEGDDALIEEAFAPQPKPVAEKAVEKPVPAKPAKKPKKKKGTSKGLVVILILALLGAGGYFGYDYAVKNNIEIPYLNNVIDYINGFINPKPKDPSGTSMLSTLEINSKFIENEKAGRIFVVTGKVRNGYTVPRKMVRLQGKLFTKGKVLAKTEQAYAGVAISDQELAGQELAQIRKRLSAAGGQGAGSLLNPGQTQPFMVVFSDLPADLDEFAIELVSSAAAQ